MNPIILAHRGYSKMFPENSLFAFEKAFEYSADGLELDIRKSQDNEIVVVHDENLKRVSGNSGVVSELTYEQIKGFQLGMNQCPPLLKDVINATPAGKSINIEIKESEVVGPLISLLGTVNRFDTMKNHGILVSSFDYESLSKVKNTLPDCRIALLVGEEAKEHGNPIIYLKGLIEKYHPFSLNLPIQLFDFISYESAVDALSQLKKAYGISYMWWTLDDLSLAQNLYKGNLLDYIITNDVESMVNNFFYAS